MKILLLPFLLFGAGCSFEFSLDGDAITGSGVEASETFELDATTAIDADSVFDVRVTIDPDATGTSVVLTGDDNIITELTVRADGDVLVLSDDDTWSFTLSSLPVAEVTMPELVSIDSSGGSRVEVLGGSGGELAAATLATLDVDTSGGSRVVVDRAVDALTSDSSGGSRLTVLGDVGTGTVEGSGGAQIELAGQSGVLTVDLSGASRLDASVDELRGSLSGGSTASLSGDADIVDVDTSGASRVLGG